MQRPEYPDWVGADRLRDGQELNDIDPSLAAFVFGNERLGLFQTPCEVVLGQTGGLASLDHQLAKGQMARRVDRFADAARA